MAKRFLQQNTYIAFSHDDAKPTWGWTVGLHTTTSLHVGLRVPSKQIVILVLHRMALSPLSRAHAPRHPGVLLKWLWGLFGVTLERSRRFINASTVKPDLIVYMCIHTYSYIIDIYAYSFTPRILYRVWSACGVLLECL